VRLHLIEILQRVQPAQLSQELESLRAVVLEEAGSQGAEIRTVHVPLSEAPSDPIAFLAVQGKRIAEAVAEAAKASVPVLVLGGNCTCLPGVIGGLQQGLAPGARIGLVWFDAHGDFNTPQTTLSGMLGGMPVAVSAGLCYPAWREGAQQSCPLPTDRIVMVDVRNLDPDEERLVRWTGITVVAAEPEQVASAARRLAEQVDLVYLHIDLDVLDAALVPTHRTREPNGPDVSQTLQAIHAVLETGAVRAVGLVSVDVNGEGTETTLRSATELLRGFLGSWLAAAGQGSRTQRGR
jgi:arginase